MWVIAGTQTGTHVPCSRAFYELPVRTETGFHNLLFIVHTLNTLYMCLHTPSLYLCLYLSLWLCISVLLLAWRFIPASMCMFCHIHTEAKCRAEHNGGLEVSRHATLGFHLYSKIWLICLPLHFLYRGTDYHTSHLTVQRSPLLSLDLIPSQEQGYCIWLLLVIC